ncbi:MAG: hypothetical protein WCR27_02010 [Eubacteriales bacterium]
MFGYNGYGYGGNVGCCCGSYGNTASYAFSGNNNVGTGIIAIAVLILIALGVIF